MNCGKCSTETVQAKDGLCRTCRMEVWRVVKYPFTEAMDARLVRAYRTAKNKTELSASLKVLRAEFRYPAFILNNRAQRLGVRITVHRPWTEEEVLRLREMDECDLAAKAKALNRSESSVKNKLFMLGYGCAVIEGYSMRELAGLFGVNHHTVSRWVRLGWLVLSDVDRVTCESIERFVWERMESYRFAACDERWLKTMLNPGLGRSSVQRVA